MLNIANYRMGDSNIISVASSRNYVFLGTESGEVIYFDSSYPGITSTIDLDGEVLQIEPISYSRLLVITDADRLYLLSYAPVLSILYEYSLFQPMQLVLHGYFVLVNCYACYIQMLQIVLNYVVLVNQIPGNYEHIFTYRDSPYLIAVGDCLLIYDLEHFQYAALMHQIAGKCVFYRGNVILVGSERKITRIVVNTSRFAIKEMQEIPVTAPVTAIHGFFDQAYALAGEIIAFSQQLQPAGRIYLDSEIIDAVEAEIDRVPFIFLADAYGMVHFVNLHANAVVASFYGLVGDDEEMLYRILATTSHSEQMRVLDEKEREFEFELFPLLIYKQNQLLVTGNRWIQVFSFEEQSEDGTVEEDSFE